MVRTKPEDRSLDRWTLNTELLAQLIEEVSVLAADMRRKKPRKVPRPAHLTGDGSSGVKRVVSVLKATQRSVRVVA